MRSRTKRALTEAQIAALVRDGLGPDAEVARHAEYTDGMYSAVYEVELADGRELVLKTAAAPSATLLRYETDLLHGEIEFYRRASAAGVPLPSCLAADPDLGYLLLTRLSGRPMTQLPELTDEQRDSLRTQAARRVGRPLAGVTRREFGYPRRDGHAASLRWRDTFGCFLDDVLADADTYGVTLPEPPEVFRGAAVAQLERLDQVTTASLVHFDLWDGNLFVIHDADGSLTLEAVIDAERCFYGDPLAEYASLTLTASTPEAADRAGRYRGQPLSEDEGARLHLYRLYLLLIMLVEPTVRGYDPVAHGPVQRWVREELDHGLGVLALRYF